MFILAYYKKVQFTCILCANILISLIVFHFLSFFRVISVPLIHSNLEDFILYFVLFLFSVLVYGNEKVREIYTQTFDSGSSTRSLNKQYSAAPH